MANKIRSKGSGSIKKVGNRYRAFFSYNGKRPSKYFGTVKEAEAWLTEQAYKRDRGLRITSSKVTVEEYISEWIEIQRTRLKPKSGHRYHQVARDYVYPYIGKMKLVDLNVDQVETLYQDLLDDGVSIRNVRYVHSLLHISLKDATRRGITVTNAAHGARQPRLTAKEMQILDEYQVNQLFIAASGHRHEALFHIAVKTGMRQGEIFGLKWSDINWENGILRVQRQVQRVTGQGMVFSTPKTKAGRRTIPLGIDTLQLLCEHRIQQEEQRAFAGDRWKEHGLIFPSKLGTPLGNSNFLKEYKALLEAAGLPQIRFHDLRHTTASILLNRSKPIFVVSKILGHSKPSTTMDIYGHLIPYMHEGLGNQIDEWLTPIPVQLGENMRTEQQLKS